jgi:hypothetical protein
LAGLDHFLKDIAMILLKKLTLLGLISALAACGGGGGDGYTIPPFWSQTGLVVADLNGDGRADVAVASTYIAGPPRHPGYVEVYLQAATGGFGLPVRYPIGPDPWGMSVGDVDNDGHPDLVVASPSTVPTQINTINSSGGISVLRQDPANLGRFLTSQWVSTGGLAEDVAVAHLDGDGRPDLVVSDAIAVNARAMVLYQNKAASGEFSTPIDLPTGSGSEDVAVADINGDGLADIVLAASSSVVVFYQRVGGGFEAPRLLAAGLKAQGVAAADLDGDGRTDIVAANAGNAPDGGTGGASATVLLQTSPGGFVATQIPVADGARRVAIADLNGDGIPDIALVSIVYQALSTPAKISVLLQSAAVRGQFTAVNTYNGALNASFIAIGDINNDGRNDIILNDGPAVLVQRSGAPGVFDAVQALR